MERALHLNPIQTYLKQKQVEFEKRGTLYMVPVLQEMIDSGVSCREDLEQKLQWCLAERNKHRKFNVEFQYFWSMATYLQDLVVHAPQAQR